MAILNFFPATVITNNADRFVSSTNGESLQSQLLMGDGEKHIKSANAYCWIHLGLNDPALKLTHKPTSVRMRWRAKKNSAGGNSVTMSFFLYGPDGSPELVNDLFNVMNYPVPDTYPNNMMSSDAFNAQGVPLKDIYTDYTGFSIMCDVSTRYNGKAADLRTAMVDHFYLEIITDETQPLSSGVETGLGYYDDSFFNFF
jgi:hypothetical protein